MTASRIIDLRAQVEAQMRTLARVEEQLSKCQTRDRGADTAAFRRAIQEMSANNLAIYEVLSSIAEDIDLQIADPPTVDPSKS